MNPDRNVQLSLASIGELTPTTLPVRRLLVRPKWKEIFNLKSGNHTSSRELNAGEQSTLPKETNKKSRRINNFLPDEGDHSVIETLQ